MGYFLDRKEKGKEPHIRTQIHKRNNNGCGVGWKEYVSWLFMLSSSRRWREKEEPGKKLGVVDGGGDLSGDPVVLRRQPPQPKKTAKYKFPVESWKTWVVRCWFLTFHLTTLSFTLDTCENSSIIAEENGDGMECGGEMKNGNSKRQKNEYVRV